MTKAQKEKQRKVMLQHILDTHPEYLKVIDSMIDNPNQELTEAISQAISPQLKKAEQQGILIGWMGYAMRAIKNIENIQTVDEIKEYFQKEADNARDRIGLKKEQN